MAEIKRRGVNRYTISVYMGRDKSGKRIYHYETFHGSPQQAKQRGHELETELKSRTGPKGLDMTVGEYLADWLERIDGTVSPRTYETYAWHVKRLIPGIGKFLMYNLSALDLQDNLRDFRGLSPRTVRGIYGTLRTALRQAVSWGILKKDPTEGLRTPRVPRKERPVLSAENLQKLLEAAKGYRYYLVIRILAFTGMRLGEVLGLKWRDIDFSAGTVVIQRAVDTKHRSLKEDTKTASSRRTIVLDQETLALLKEQKSKIEKSKVKPIRIENILVFQPEIVGGKLLPVRDDAIRRTLNSALKKAEIPHIRIHDLRHTAGSILLSEGISLTNVADFLGHSSPATTASVYAHVLKRSFNVADVLKSRADKNADRIETEAEK